MKYQYIIVAVVTVVVLQLVGGTTPPACKHPCSSDCPATKEDSPSHQIKAGQFLNMTLNMDETKQEDGFFLVKAQATLAAVNLQTTENKATPKLPLNISLVLDTSGSMEENDKMKCVISATKTIAQNLDAADFLSVITYSTDGKLVLPSTSENKNDAITQVIDSIDPVGATNISHGIELATTEIEKQLSDSYKNHIILLSDGKANFGIKDPKQLVGLAESLWKRGISLSTVGIGTDFNKTLMYDMARAGKGNFYDVQDSRNVLASFSKDIHTVKNAVIKNINLSVTCGNDVIIEGFKPLHKLSCQTSFDKERADFTLQGLGSKETAGFEVSFKWPITANTQPVKVASFVCLYRACRNEKEISENLKLDAMYHHKDKGQSLWFAGSAP